MRYTYLLIALFALLATAPAAAQTIPPEITRELAERDIDQTELMRRLEEKGIEVEGKSQAEILRLRPQIEATIAEMEAEKEVANPPNNPTQPEEGDENEEPAPEPAPEKPAPPVIKPPTLPESNLYGHNMFRNKSLEVYRASENTTPPGSYPLKAGDEIAVTIFGASQTDFILRLDDSGFVQLPNTLRIPLAGIALEDARLILARRLKQYYTFRDGQLSIRIQAARTITVSIFGEVERNGSFTMSSLNTGFNALVAAGGPTDRGTVREIQLIQGDKTTILDVYDYLQNPAQGTGLFLNDNSTLFVPMAKKVITVEGGVERPMTYELKGEETLADLIDFAGGPSVRAETGNLSITRYVDGQLELINVDLATQPDFEMRNGDVVTLPVIETPIQNFVTVEGAVLLPGRYPFTEEMRVADVLRQSRLRPGARTDVAFLFRFNDDGTRRLQRLNVGADAGAENVGLQRGDVLRILSQRAFANQATIKVSGAIRDTSVIFPFPQDGALTLEEAVLLAGGTRENTANEVMLIRTPTTNREERRYQRLDLTVDANFQLFPLDEIVVYPNERFTDGNRTVSISGAVRQSGTYVFDPSLTLPDLIYLAGGLRTSAATERVDVFRLAFVNGAETRTLVETIDISDPDAANFELRVYDEIVVRNAAEYEPIQSVTLRGEVRYPGKYALLEDNERLSDLVRRAGGLTPEAFPEGANMFRPQNGVGPVVLDLRQAIEDQASPVNMVLRMGDTLFIPKRQELVTIQLVNTVADDLGVDSLQVGRTIQVAYQGEKPADWYIKRYAGGFNSETAKRRWTTVQYANGQIKETASFAGIHNYPEVRAGSTIQVPSKPEKIVKQRREERFDWIGLAAVIMGAATTIVTLIVIRQ